MASPRGAGAFACGGSRTRLRVAGDCRTRGVSRVTHLPPERTRLRPPKVTNLASPGVAMRHAIRACATQKPAVLIGCGAAPHAAADSQSARRAMSPPQAPGLPHMLREVAHG